jgi:TrmH family RNA methyltransferase
MKRPSSWAGSVEDVRRALAPAGRRQLGEFAVEGTRLIERALRAGKTPTRAIVAESAPRNDTRTSELALLLREAGTVVTSVPDAVVLELSQGRKGSTVFALCELPREEGLSEFALRALSFGPLLVLVDLEEPGNVGALVRTALASGAAGVVAVGTSDPYHPKAVRTSMGSLFKIPIVTQYEIEPVIEQLSPLRRLAAVSSGGVAPWAASFEPQLALFVGKESHGLPPQVIARLDGTMTIPMPGGVDSYSVNAAAAVLLYEVGRRNALQNGHGNGRGSVPSPGAGDTQVNNT